jgi:hypothetical protein
MVPVRAAIVLNCKKREKIRKLARNIYRKNNNALKKM